jgi:hypothetical protein
MDRISLIEYHKEYGGFQPGTMRKKLKLRQDKGVQLNLKGIVDAQKVGRDWFLEIDKRILKKVQ